MRRGLSGGEKKRANIANELLTDPAVLLLDEPTSGLDSTTAYELAHSLKRYAVNNNKTVVMTVHQPSSQMFFLFNKVILLCNGEIMYHGTPNNVLEYFEKLGHVCDIPHYNPADHILDVAKSNEKTVASLIKSCYKARMNIPDCPVLIKSVENEVKTDADNVEMDCCNGNNVEKRNLLDYPGVHRDSCAQPTTVDEMDVSTQRWTTSFTKQLKVLTHRSIVQGRSRYKDKLSYIKTFGVALICGLVWWQIGRGEPYETAVSDIAAVLFFATLYNSFSPLFEVLMTFPDERVVINKERMAGSYRLSAYYLAKLISEIPFTMTTPSIYIVIVYWMSGLNGFNNFFAFIGSWGVIVITAIACQSIGIFASAATMDFKRGIVVGILLMITFLLLGGFYVKNIPPWLTWLRYLSPITHAWTLLLYLEFDEDRKIRCSDNVHSFFPSCVSNDTMTSDTAMTNETTQMYVDMDDIMRYNLADVPVYACVAAIFGIALFYRILGYLCLRFLHKPAVK